MKEMHIYILLICIIWEHGGTEEEQEFNLEELHIIFIPQIFFFTNWHNRRLKLLSDWKQAEKEWESLRLCIYFHMCSSTDNEPDDWWGISCMTHTYTHTHIYMHNNLSVTRASNLHLRCQITHTRTHRSLMCAGFVLCPICSLSLLPHYS